MTEQKIRRAKTKADHKSAPKAAGTKPPWEKENPKKPAGEKKKLTPAQKAEAKARAEKAGRAYPNLVDNMAVLKKSAQKP